MFTLRLGPLLKGGRPADPEMVGPKSDLQAQIDVAHREWQAAQQYFEMVSDPELIDHAIYTLEAAHRKYRYLMRRLREGQDT